MTNLPRTRYTTFTTLLTREWLQHRRGWWILMAVPLVVCLLVGLFGEMQINLTDDEAPASISSTPAALIAMACLFGLAFVTQVLAWAASVFQAPGLARRDVQDRSIEFWLSLPVSNTHSLGALLFMHLVLVPWLALAVGAAGGLVLSLVLIAKASGVAAWFSVPWWPALVALAALMLRVALGLVLATLWLSPLILLLMAASAWLKRWGVPVVLATLGLGGLLLDKLYGLTFVWDVLGALARQAAQALFVADRGASARSLALRTGDDVPAALAALPAWAVHDLGKALQALVSPGFLAALAVAAGCFALLLLRRRQAR